MHFQQLTDSLEIGFGGFGESESERQEACLQKSESERLFQIVRSNIIINALITITLNLSAILQPHTMFTRSSVRADLQLVRFPNPLATGMAVGEPD